MLTFSITFFMVFTPRSPNLQVFFAQKMEILLSRAVENRGEERRLEIPGRKGDTLLRTISISLDCNLFMFGREKKKALSQ